MMQINETQKKWVYKQSTEDEKEYTEYLLYYGGYNIPIVKSGLLDQYTKDAINDMKEAAANNLSFNDAMTYHLNKVAERKPRRTK